MKLIREYENESLDTLCHIVDMDNQPYNAVGIDEQNLAWMFVDPDYSNSDCCEKLFAWALNLLGDRAWLVLQTSEEVCRELLETYSIDIIEQYQSESLDSRAIDLIIARQA